MSQQCDGAPETFFPLLCWEEDELFFRRQHIQNNYKFKWGADAFSSLFILDVAT